MEWVETTGKTIEEAKDLALDQLGVDEQDAEFDVLEEPRTGLFGRVRGEARVRARVRPTQPRPKADRRERRGRGNGRDGRSGGRSTDGRKGKDKDKDKGSERPSRAPASESPTGGGADDVATTPAPEPAAAATAPREGDARPRRNRSGARNRPARHDHDDEQETIEMSDTELAEQGEVVRGFLLDLLDAFGLDGEVTATPAEEGAVELAVTGPDLGLLIGPKGQTLQAIQELSRSVLQRQHPGDVHARIRVDVAGYRQRRREALERFVRQIAEDVKSSGVQKALEPMSPPDRKVVHDTVNEIDGVHTVSEGEDTRRRVVILPD